MARELKLTQTLSGWFDVKVYNERIARENWKLNGEDDQIAFTVTFAAGDTAALPFAAHGKPYTDGSGNPRLRVNFKIGTRCDWFDEQAQPISKPLNSVLDGRQYECVIQYSTLDGDPTNPKSPRGYWANAIQLREVKRNPFAAMPGAAPAPPMPQQPQPQPQPQYQQPQQYQPQQPQYQLPQPQPQPQQYQPQQPQYQQPQQYQPQQPQYQLPQPQPQPQQYQPQRPQQQPQPQYQQPQQYQPQQPQYQQPQQQPTGNIGFPPPPVDDIIAPRGMSAPMPPMYNDSDNLPY